MAQLIMDHGGVMVFWHQLGTTLMVVAGDGNREGTLVTNTACHF